MKLHFDARSEGFAVARLAPDEALPGWATRGTFFSITRTERELSIVCEEPLVPAGIEASRGWKCLTLRGPFAFTEIGIAAEFTAILAKAGVSVLVVSSYDTDAVLVPAGQLDRAAGALTAVGHVVTRAD